MHGTKLILKDIAHRETVYGELETKMKGYILKAIRADGENERSEPQLFLSKQDFFNIGVLVEIIFQSGSSPN